MLLLRHRANIIAETNRTTSSTKPNIDHTVFIWQKYFEQKSKNKAGKQNTIKYVYAHWHRSNLEKRSAGAKAAPPKAGTQNPVPTTAQPAMRAAQQNYTTRLYG
jgi:hypothetical protein